MCGVHRGAEGRAVGLLHVAPHQLACDDSEYSEYNTAHRADDGTHNEDNCSRMQAVRQSIERINHPGIIREIGSYEKRLYD